MLLSKSVFSATILSLLLGGCATNALRLEYATNVSASGKVAVAASRNFLVKVDETRVASNLDLIALDPACAPLEAFVRNPPDIGAIKSVTAPPRGWLCAANADATTFSTPLSLAPLGNDLEPTFELIDALGAYSAAIAKIVDTKGPDASADFLEAVGLARSAEGLLRVFTGGSAVVPAADDKRLGAIDDFIKFVDALHQEQDKVKKLRKFTDSEAGNGAVIAALKDHLANWQLSRQGDENLRFTLAGVMLAQAAKATPPLSPTQRREAGKQYYDRAAALVSSAQFSVALTGLLDELAAADADLRQVFKENPDLTDEERAKVARLTLERVTNAFETLPQIALSFKGG